MNRPPDQAYSNAPGVIVASGVELLGVVGDITWEPDRNRLSIATQERVGETASSQPLSDPMIKEGGRLSSKENCFIAGWAETQGVTEALVELGAVRIVRRLRTGILSKPIFEVQVLL